MSLEIYINYAEVFEQFQEHLDVINRIKVTIKKIYEEIPGPEDGLEPYFSITKSGWVSLDTSSINSDSFINFENLTKETILSWVEASDDYQEMVDLIDSEYNQLFGPVKQMKSFSF